MAEFKMPTLGADMTAGTLIKWLKGVGDKVNRGDIIAEVDTDKGVIEVEVFSDGVIGELLAEPGAEVPVGTPLAIINETGETADVETTEIAEAEIAQVETGETAKVETGETADAPPRGPRLRVSPSARKLAEDLGVDLSLVRAGRSGRIQREDVELAARTKDKQFKPAETVSEDSGFSRMRQAIGAAMARSKREIPHYYLSTAIDFSRALAWLSRENERRPLKDRILYGVLLLKAVALALRQVPEFNAIWEDGRVTLKERVNVGAAISLRQGGLIAPALFDTDKQTLGELMRQLRELVSRSRAGTLRSSEMSESTITVTNLGEQSVETVFGVIYPPQVALVGFGKIYESVSVVDGRIKGCHKINATLSADHRASDGHRGAIFLAAIDRILQEPEKL